MLKEYVWNLTFFSSDPFSKFFFFFFWRQVFEPYLNVVKKSVDMRLTAEDGGSLNLIIPRNILDSKQANGTDFRYIVLLDGTPIEYQEVTREENDLSSNVANNSRVVSVFIPPGSTSLEIIGTTVL